jgi:hypothetical protein
MGEKFAKLNLRGEPSISVSDIFYLGEPFSQSGLCRDRLSQGKFRFLSDRDKELDDDDA